MSSVSHEFSQLERRQADCHGSNLIFPLSHNFLLLSPLQVVPLPLPRAHMYELKAKRFFIGITMVMFCYS